MTPQLGAWMTHAGETGNTLREGHSGPYLQLPGVSRPNSAAVSVSWLSQQTEGSESEQQRFVRRKTYTTDAH